MARHAKKTRNISTTTKVAATGLALGAGAAMLAPSATAAPVSDWERLAQCESGGNWSINTGNGYYGGLQFSAQTWTGFGGGEFAPYAHQATKDEQIWVAEKVLAQQGWNAWPACSRQLGLSSGPTQRPKPGTGNVNPAPAPAPAPESGANNDGADKLDPAAIIDNLFEAADISTLDDIFSRAVDEARNAGVPVPQEVVNIYNQLRSQLPN